MRKSLKILSTFAILLATLNACAQGKQYVIGILPVDDESTESLTEFLPTGLSMLLYNHMLDLPNIQPVLLGPGGLYDPGSKDWIQEYGKKSHVDVLLISRLLPTIKVNDRHRRLSFAIEMMDVSTGTVSPKMVNDSVEVQTADLLTTLGTSYISSNTTSGFFANLFRDPSDFEKQHLGKAALKLVDWTNSSLQTSLPSLVVSPSGAPVNAKSQVCRMSFRIRFMTKHSIAKGYSLLAADKDQSSSVNDGIATFDTADGPLVIRVQIPDPPYGIPVQKLYQTSTIFSCSNPAHLLTMEIGAAGETLLRWE
jgi:hypothetical protein